MAKKKKKSKYQRRLQRQKEILKAQKKSERKVVQEVKATSRSASVETKKVKEPRQTKYALPIQEIKHDLVKIAVFAVFSILFLVVLRVSGIDFAYLKSLLPV
jgi:hypothetical protein